MDRKDEYIRIRLTKENKDKLTAICDNTGLNMTDVITNWICDNKPCDNNVHTKMRVLSNKIKQKKKKQSASPPPVPPEPKLTMGQFISVHPEISPGKYRECYNKYLAE